MRHAQHHKNLLPVLLILAMCGCANNASVTSPTPPQVQLAGYVNVLAKALDGASAALVAARDQGKMSAADFTSARTAVSAIAACGKNINAELRSADAWSLQKAKISGIIATAGLSQVAKLLPTTAAMVMAEALAAFNQLAMQVGGPTI